MFRPAKSAPDFSPGRQRRCSPADPGQRGAFSPNVQSLTLISARTAAEVDVLAVIKGQNRVGQRVNVSLHDTRKDRGQVFILSGSWSLLGPAFPVLPLELKDEVRFLTRPDESVNTLEDAVVRIQGASRVSQDAALRFLAEHRAEAFPVLVARFREAVAQTRKKEPRAYPWSRIEGLSSQNLRLPAVRSCRRKSPPSDGLRQARSTR